MIDFITSYDPATNANYDVYKDINKNGSIALVENDATRELLEDALSSERSNLFAMSHGYKNVLKAQNRHAAIDSLNIHLLRDKKCFVYACYTATELGEIASINGGIWMGYTKAINSPETEPIAKPLFVELFTYIYNHFTSVNCMTSANIFLEALKNICDEKRAQLHDSVNSDYPLICPSTAMREMWTLLQIWLPTESTPLAHHEAPPSFFEW